MRHQRYWKTLSLCLLPVMSAAAAQPNAGMAASSEARSFVREQEKHSAAGHQPTSLPDVLQGGHAPALSPSNTSFIDGLVAKQKEAAQGEAFPVEGARYFVSFSIPEAGLRRMVSEAHRFGIPATLRGMVGGDMKETALRVQALVEGGSAAGVQIDPQPFEDYRINAVPALVVYCRAGFDVVRGNLLIEQALDKVAQRGDCAQTAKAMLQKGGVVK